MASPNDPTKVLEALIEAVCALPMEQRLPLLGRAEALVSVLRAEPTASIEAEAPWAWPLHNLAPELLMLFCSRMDDRTVFGGLAGVARSLHDTIQQREFLTARGQLRLADLPADVRQYADGCACLLHPKGAPEALGLYFDTCVDYSRGSEPCTVTVSTIVSIVHQQREVRFHSQLPSGLVDGSFCYDAGPWPAAVALQVCRAGDISCGKGFGVRTLEPIAFGSFVCTFWGAYRDYDEAANAGDASNGSGSPHVLFGDETLQPCDLPWDVDAEGGFDRTGKGAPCPFCGRASEPAPDDGGQDGSGSRSGFCIDASSFGNVARCVSLTQSPPLTTPRVHD
jgi:hypothetical protein